MKFSDGQCFIIVDVLFLLSGTKDIEIGVDNDGFIFLSFEGPEAEEGSFRWNKNYREAIDAGRAHLETKQKKYVQHRHR